MFFKQELFERIKAKRVACIEQICASSPVVSDELRNNYLRRVLL